MTVIMYIFCYLLCQQIKINNNTCYCGRVLKNRKTGVSHERPKTKKVD